MLEGRVSVSQRNQATPVIVITPIMENFVSIPTVSRSIIFF